MSVAIQITYTGLNEDELAGLLWLGLAETNTALPQTEDREALVERDVQLPGDVVRAAVQIGLMEHGMKAAMNPQLYAQIRQETWCRKAVKAAYVREEPASG